MEEIFIIHNGEVVLPDKVLSQGAVVLEGNLIREICPKGQWEDRYPGVRTLDVQGNFLFPGFIDIHSDNIETVIQPRPQSMIDFELAMREQEKQLVNQGITTMFHSLSMTNGNVRVNRSSLRTPENLTKLAGLIRRFHEGDHLIRHRFHCRYDITNLDCYPLLLEFIRRGDMQLLSFTDHTPGQGQYRDLEFFKQRVMAQDQSDEEKERILRQRMERAKLTAQQLEEAADLAAEKGIAIASHDDDSLEKLEYVTSSLHAGICEFPVELDVARAAREKGMQVVVGATNVLMGRSHSNNLSARKAIQEGCADILVSDYFPPALLHAVFRLWEEGMLTLPQAVNMTSRNPARAVGIGQWTGSIEEGKCGDLLVVGKKDGLPVILQVFINGQMVSNLCYRNDFIREDGTRYD